MKSLLAQSFRRGAVAALWAVLLVPFSGFVRADDLRETSLSLVPAETSFYVSLLRGREQYEALVNSKAFARFKELPFVQEAWTEFTEDGDFEQFQEWLAQPENKQAVALLLEGLSDEVFLHGDAGFAELMALATQMNQVTRQAQFAAIAGGDPEEAIKQGVIALLNKHLDTLQVPDLVLGMKISNQQAAQAQLDRLQRELSGLLESEAPELKDRLSRVKLAGGDFLTLRLDGSLIPWDDLRDGAGPELDKLRDKVTPMTAAVTVGVHKGYVLFSLGNNNDHLASLGEGALLVDRQELLPLRQHQDRRVSGTSFVSGDFLRRANQTQRQIEDMFSSIKTLLPLFGLNGDLTQEINKDLDELTKDIQSAIPEPASASSISFLTERGAEGYSYSWGERPAVDATRPLPILSHVGGDPLLAIAGRARYSTEGYDTLVKWVRRGFDYFEKLGVERLGQDERDFYNRVRDDLVKFGTRLDEITRNKLGPSLKDGQGAFVLDARSTSTQWLAQMPVSAQPLPMLEPAIVYGVSDAALLKEAGGEYLKVLQELCDALQVAEPTRIPQIQIPQPEFRDFPPHGGVYYYRLPKILGLEAAIAPNAGLNNDTLILAAMPKMTVRLLETRPLEITGPLAQRLDQPLAGVFYLNWPRLVDAVVPWVDYGISQSGETLPDEINDQIDTCVLLLKCFRGAAGVTYRENDVWVTHSEARFEDLP